MVLKKSKILSQNNLTPETNRLLKIANKNNCKNVVNK